MSFAITHFAFGALMTTLIAALVRPRFPYPRTLAAAGGAWALVPDVHWVSPWFVAETLALHDSTLANLFWFHRLFDTLDPEKSELLAATMVVGLILMTAVIEVSLRRNPEETD